MLELEAFTPTNQYMYIYNIYILYIKYIYIDIDISSYVNGEMSEGLDFIANPSINHNSSLQQLRYFLDVQNQE